MVMRAQAVLTLIYKLTNRSSCDLRFAGDTKPKTRSTAYLNVMFTNYRHRVNPSMSNCVQPDLPHMSQKKTRPIQSNMMLCYNTTDKVVEILHSWCKTTE